MNYYHLIILFDNEQQLTIMLFRQESFYLIDLFNEEESIVGYCLKHDIKVLMNNNVDKIFRTAIGSKDDTEIPIPLYASLRLTPWFLCLLDILSRIFYLIVMGIICINDYGASYGFNYSITNHHIGI
jgi:hypothetical protein